jgi:pyrroline-5-carboxylate reductase
MKVGFAGAGSMAAAMARGLAAQGGPVAMLFTDAGSGRAQALAEETGGARLGSLGELGARSDLIILAVKPAALEQAAAELGGFEGPIVSVLGATTLDSLRAAFPTASLLRAMPNVAVEVGRGVICHAPPENAAALGPALALLGTVATLYELDEELIDPATAVMGCSPAYLAQACEALAVAGAEAGLSPGLAGELIAAAAAGTGELLLRHEPAAIQRAVASPGGSTEAGLEALAEHGAPEAFKAAVAASLERMGASG